MSTFPGRKLQIKYNMIRLLSGILLIPFFSCTKLTQIPPPSNSITTSQVFADSGDIASAISGIYSEIEYRSGGVGFCNGSQTLYCGLASDELVPSLLSGDPSQIYLNQVFRTNGTIYNDFWYEPYTFIYEANACIEGIQGSTTVPEMIKNHYLGEAKFFRALFYLYMVNLFGDVPDITSTAWASTSLSSRASKPEVYHQIISDLKDAQNFLPTDYSYSNGQRTRANYWAATALLARVYLYTDSFTNAAAEATSVINNPGLFSLDTLNGVFLVNSTEAILQWQLNTEYIHYTATNEGDQFVPFSGEEPPYYLSSQMLNAFEPGDKRRTAWVDSVNYGGNVYWAPYKYKNGADQAVAGGVATEYYTVLRLAEQFLIRAEAEANGANGGPSAAITDLNVIRNRAGLSNYSGLTDQTSVLNAIYHERQIELFAEWGHRWFDLKRTGQINSVMSIVTPQKMGGGNWNSYQQLFPIPQAERNLDPNLTQNEGY
jgi:starch-binding outer membrane protein, SusD/RagB family